MKNIALAFQCKFFKFHSENKKQSHDTIETKAKPYIKSIVICEYILFLYF